MTNTSMLSRCRHILHLCCKVWMWTCKKTIYLVRSTAKLWMNNKGLHFTESGWVIFSWSHYDQNCHENSNPKQCVNWGADRPLHRNDRTRKSPRRVYAVHDSLLLTLYANYRKRKGKNNPKKKQTKIRVIQICFIPCGKIYTEIRWSRLMSVNLP